MDKSFSQKIISYLEEKLNSNSDDYSRLFVEIKKMDFDSQALCFDYILKNKTEQKLLYQTIKEINSLRAAQNLDSLIDFILKPAQAPYFSDLKVLAIKTISNYKNTKALPSLLYCLNDKASNYKIRLASAEALGKIGDKNAFEALTNVAIDEKEKSGYVKESAIVALGMLGDNRALDVFNSIMSSKNAFLDKFSYIKERIVEAIKKFDVSKNKKALEILKNSLLDPSKQVRIEAIEALMDLELNQSYDLIYDRLCYDDNLEVKKNALIALYNLSDRRILDKIINGDFEDELKLCAIEIINENEDEDD